MSSVKDETSTILEQKIQAYDAFHAATGLLQQALENDDMSAVCRLIKNRDALIRHIDGLDRRFNRQPQSGLSRHNPATSRRLVKQSAELGERLKEILSANQACNVLAARRCETLRKEMAAMRQSEEARHGYVHKAHEAPKFLSVRT